MATDEPLSGRCGARTRSGGYCEKYPADGRDRCRFHGGASSGPDDVDHLEDNDHAAGNPGGGASELNMNAAAHGGFAALEKIEPRLPPDQLHHHARYVWSLVKRSRETRPWMDDERRQELARRAGLWRVRQVNADMDTLGGPDARGFAYEEETELETGDGETVTVTRPKVNPALTASLRASARQRALWDELGLFDDV